MTFWDTIKGGDYVMIALAVIFIAGVVIFWVRCVQLSKDRERSLRMMERVKDYVMEGDIENARHQCEITKSAGSTVVNKGLKKLGSPISEVKEAILEVSTAEKGKMCRGEGWLLNFVVISPLLGFGGTLLGVTDRLRDFGEAGLDVNTATVCSALAPTVVTAIAGFGVGIVSMIFLSILKGRIKKAKGDLDAIGIEFIELLNEPV